MDQRKPGDFVPPYVSSGSLLGLEVRVSSPLQSSFFVQATEKSDVAASEAENKTKPIILND